MVNIARLLFLQYFIGWAIGQQVFCPGDQVTINCTSSDRVLWSGTLFDGQCPPENRINIQTITADNINDTYTCGSIVVNITDFGPEIVSPGIEILISTSLLTFRVTSSALDQRTFACRDGAQIVVSGVLSVPAVPMPSLSVSQSSLTTVTVVLTVADRRCALMYFVEITRLDSNDPLTVINRLETSINVTDLDLCMNRYSVAGYVQAPSGFQGERSSSQEIQVDLSVLQGVNNVRVTTPSILEWIQLPNTRSDCINGYTISWSEGQVTSSVETTATTISESELISNGFPYCQLLTVTVTPTTSVGHVSSGSNSTDVLFEQPGLVAPVVQAMFAQSDGSFQITVEWEPISMEIAPTRLYGFNKVGDGECQPEFPGSDVSGSRIVPGAVPGNQYRVCVAFVNKDCMVSTTLTEQVPPILFSGTQTASVGDNGFSVKVTLPPSPPMNLSSFNLLIYSLIYSTVDPGPASAVSADYPNSSQEYTVTFDGLTPGTYTYNIRVVLRNDNTTTIGLPVTGSFTVEVPGCGTVCVTVVIVVCVLVVVAVLCLAGGFGAYKYKTRSKEPKKRLSKSKDATKHELTRSSPPPPADSLYADPNSIEHAAAPGTEDQYAMVDRKGKKNTKPKPTPSETLYQDPNTIEHETAASGDTYAVVDKPKRSSKKKGGPDVVPPASELTYADIDLSSKRPKPGSGRQAPQQPGEYPKEHPVEYSSVDHGNTSQL